MSFGNVSYHCITIMWTKNEQFTNQRKAKEKKTQKQTTCSTVGTHLYPLAFSFRSFLPHSCKTLILYLSTNNFHLLRLISQEHLWLLLPPQCFGTSLSGSGIPLQWGHGDNVLYPIWVPLGDPADTDTNRPQIRAWRSSNNNLQKLSSVLPP